MTKHTPLAVLDSVLIHVVVAGSLVFLARALPAAAPARAEASAPIEIELRAPAPPPAPSSAPADAPAARVEAPAAPAPSARNAPRAAHLAPAALTASGAAAESGAAVESTAGTSPGAIELPATTAPAAAARPSIDGLSVLHSLGSDANAAAQAGVIALGRPGSGRGPRDLVPREQGTPEERARAATQGYVENLLRETNRDRLPAGVPRYYWSLQRRMVESWNPEGLAPAAPSMAAALLAPLTVVGEASRQAARDALGPLADGRGRAAVEANPRSAISDPGRTSETQTALLPLTQSSSTTRAEVELDQDPTGRVIAVRLARSSRSRRFDEAALAAVRAAVPLQAPVPMPGGRRSRWAFEVVASRDSITSLGISFDESRGWFQPHLPGMVHTRARVQVVSSQPLAPPGAPRR